MRSDYFRDLVKPVPRPIPEFRQDPETLRELFEERAGIMQHDGGLSREQAEREAARLVGLN